jgi:arylsulfatase A-like enzyme
MGRKNLLVILCDQLQRQLLGPYGGQVPTPNLDKLAARAAVYDNFYCATPLCVPTRPSMMTGRWPHAHGATSFGKDFETVHSGEQLLIDHLLDQGYHVGYEGIWHINRYPEDQRSDEYAHFQPRGFPYKEHLRMMIEQGGRDGDQRAPVRTPTDSGRIHDWAISIPVPACWTDDQQDHPDKVIARNISEFVRSAPVDRPFAAWCSLGGPHPPIVVPEPYYSMFAPGDITPPESLGEDLRGLPGPVRDAPGAQSVRDWTWEDWAKSTAVYWGFVAYLDNCIGEVLDGLEASGREEDTVVIATCDHGEMMGAHNLYQKGVFYDESIHIPFMLAGPGIVSGRRQQFGSQVDIPSTVLDLLNLPELPNVQGKSLVPSLQSADLVDDQVAFVEFNGYTDGGIHTRGIISGKDKYIYHHGDTDQLFDLEADPFELENISNRPDYNERRETLRNQLANWMASTGDFIEPSWPA